MAKFSRRFLLLLCVFFSSVYAELSIVENEFFRVTVSSPDSTASNQTENITATIIPKFSDDTPAIVDILNYFFDSNQQSVPQTFPPFTSSEPNDIALDLSDISVTPGRSILIRFITKNLTSPTVDASIDLTFITPNITSLISVPISIPVDGIEPPADEIDNLIEENSGEYVTTEVPYNNQSVNTHSCVEISQSEIGNSANCSCTTGKCKCPKPAGIATTTTGSNDNQAGDPVMLNSLEYVMNMIVMQMAGRGLDYEFAMTYRSRINFHGRLGRNWSFNYDMRVAADPDDSNTIILYNGMGRGDAYTLINGSFVSPEFHFKRIVQDDDDFLLLRESDGTIYRFFPLDQSAKAGLLESITTSCGNRTSHEFDDEGKLLFTLDSLSRRIDYAYDEIGHITKITDFTGREVKFVYSENDDLIEITTPAVTGTPNGNDFPNGKTYKFTYSQGFADEKLNHNMISVTFPNEVLTNGDPRIINFYDADDRVIMQEWGGTNASGVTAGGTVGYVREIVNNNAQELDEIFEKTTVVDRNQNVTEFSYNNQGLLLKREEFTRDIRSNDPESFVTTYKYNNAQLLEETILPEGNKVLYEYDSANTDIFQRGNLRTVTQLPDTTRGGDQQFIQVRYEYEPVYNKVFKVTESRGNDPNFTPQNGGATSQERYTAEYIPDYFEANLDTVGCSCGFTLQDLIDKFGVDITSVADKINQGDLNGDGRIDNICGNTIVIRTPKVNLRANSPQVDEEGSTIQVIETRMAHTEFGQYLFIETPEGEITTFKYNSEGDPDGDTKNILTGNNNLGNPINTESGGYLKEVIVDNSHSSRYRNTAEPTNIKMEFTYDRLGNRTSVKDGRGIVHQTVYNQLNQVVEVTRAADVSDAAESGLVAFAYKVRVAYDANNNVILSQVEVRDSNNPDLPNFLPGELKYDILDNVIESKATVNNVEVLTSRYRYDANENLVEVITPEAIDGLQTNNRVVTAYDERDLVLTTTGAPGAAEEKTLTYNYDLNGNLVEVIDAEDNNGDGVNESSLLIYDGFDRVKRALDAVGNETVVLYDPASNVIKTSVFGLTGGISRNSNDTSGNVLLAETETFYDELSRVFRSDVALFLANGVTTSQPIILADNDAIPNDGKVTSFISYDRNSRTTFIEKASPNNAPEISSIEYDGAQRQILATDPEGNQIAYTYDDNSNPIRIVRTDINPTDRIADEEFTTINVFDSLNRPVRTTDNIGQTTRFIYDSRNLLIKSSDAQGATVPDPLGLFAGNINNDGNISEVVHDGLGRTIRSIRELRLDGQGGNPLDLSNPANSDGKIVETTTYNKNSRVTSVSDDNGNDTTYQYDNLNRLVTTTQADGRTISYEYDRDNNMISYIDHNGTICTHQFDGIHRLVQKNITRSITNNIVGTTAQTFEYDGLSRLTKATDNNDPADTTDDSTVIRKYDSLSRMVEEQQNNESILLGWREISELAERIYPNNRKINYSYDKLDRLKTISDNSDNSNPVATYDYIGYRLLERTYKNNTRLTMLNDAGDTNIGYDEAPRLVEMRHLKQDNTLVAGYTYNYNRVNFQTSKLILDQPQLSEVYKLDSLYRVVDFKRGTLNGDQTTIVGPVVNTQDWQIDGVGNWAKTTIDDTTQNQTVNNMNEYDSFGAVSFAHDDNGNMTDDGQHLFTYDAMNRITTVIDKASNELIATYKYDVMNRRTSKQFKRTAEIQNGDTEYTPDANTVALYHYNQKSGKVIDSSSNNNHGKAPRFIKRGIEGLFNTTAVQIKKLPITVKDSKSFSEIEDQLTVETFVFIDSKKWKHCTTGALVHKLGSFELEIDRKTKKACFTVRTKKIKNKKNRKHKKHIHKKFKHDKAKVCSDNKIPQDQWVHIAGVYDGDKLNIYINCQKQQDEQQLNGDVKDNRAPMFLGGFGLSAKLEETRISSVARTVFNCNPANGGGGQETVLVKRSFFYSGWRVVEEREQTASEGQGFGSAKVTRQYIDGAGIDEHLTIDTYNEDGTAIESTLYFHENARGDTIALTDENGDTHSRMEYTTYGEAFLTDENNELIPLENVDEIVYTFQGRRVDAETGLMYFRNRYYNQKLGRFLQRDPLGYVDSYGLYEAFAGNPYTYKDPYGEGLLSKLFKKLGKKVALGEAKEFIEKEIKKQIKKQIKDKELIKEILGDFEEISQSIENSWLESTISWIPVVGDCYDLYNFSQKLEEYLRLVEEFEKILNSIINIKNQIRKLQNFGFTSKQLQEIVNAMMLSKYKGIKSFRKYMKKSNHKTKRQYSKNFFVGDCDEVSTKLKTLLEKGGLNAEISYAERQGGLATSFYHVVVEIENNKGKRLIIDLTAAQYDSDKIIFTIEEHRSLMQSIENKKPK